MDGSQTKHEEIAFTVDSALLRELGERLVGQPHIALAELVKNAYDADAREVIIRVEPDHDLIEVADDGHGMTAEEFRSFWMRIGSPHKQEYRVSRQYGRPLTGSKGVGRLSVQFLGSKVTVRTVAESAADIQLHAEVDWDQAVAAGELTQATASVWTEDCERERYPGESAHGTVITITGLTYAWTGDSIERLAREIWWLRPPLQTRPDDASVEDTTLSIRFESKQERLVKLFEDQMKRILQIWYAEIIGKLERVRKEDNGWVGRTAVKVVFADDTVYEQFHDIQDCNLNSASFRILVYHIQHRQKFGIKVDYARDYLEQYGGVHVYDGGFRLPYYGYKDADWLGIEYDHSRRIAESGLLPDDLQVSRGMQFLPTIRRLIGVVEVNTAQERERAEPERLKENRVLQVQITRDRLISNRAYDNLRDAVRWALDYYATREASRQFEEKTRRKTEEPPPMKFRRAEEVLEHYRESIPEPVYGNVIKHVREAIVAVEAETESYQAHAGLLGSLATAGMAALAYEHEFNRHFGELERIADDLERSTAVDARKSALRIREWTTRVRAARRLFGHLLYEENREEKGRFRVLPVLEQVCDQVKGVLRGVQIRIEDVPEGLRFPVGRFMEWSAIFQNVLVNAYNAMLDSERRVIWITARRERTRGVVVIEDTGYGIDLKAADELFKPFARRTRISPERRGLGLGGSGLGLTIVKMIADSLGCNVRFVPPRAGYATAFELSWKED